MVIWILVIISTVSIYSFRDIHWKSIVNKRYVIFMYPGKQIGIFRAGPGYFDLIDADGPV